MPALDELAAVIRAERIDFVQFAYSINVRDAEARLLPLCAERGIAVLVNQPFDSGELFRKVRGKPLPAWAAEIDCASWGQFFLKYILGHPAVTCVIPGTAKPEHMRDNIGAGTGPAPRRGRSASAWRSSGMGCEGRLVSRRLRRCGDRSSPVQASPGMTG